MRSNDSNRRSVIVAAITASFLLLMFGLTYRVLAARLSAPLSKTPIDPGALERFPMQIADWTGEDVPFDEAEAILGKIYAEASINRCYSRGDGVEYIMLFIAAAGVTGASMVGHAPEVCNVLSGYSLVDQRFAELPIDDVTKLPCRVLQFSRGESLDPERKTVLYYYMADSQFCGNRSQLRSGVRRGSTMVRCIAQVQIAASSTETRTADSRTQMVSDFAVDSASAMARLFENIEKDCSSAESATAPQGK